MAENHLPQGDDVAQQENNGFGPLFKRRGKTATFTSVIAVLIISAMLFFTVKGKEKKLPSLEFTIALQTLSVVLGEMIRRLILVSEEFKHISTGREFLRQLSLSIFACVVYSLLSFPLS